MSKKKTLLIVLTGAVVAIGALFAVRAAGSNPDRILARAEKYFQEQSFDEARLEYFKVLGVDQKNSRAIRQLGFTWAEMGVPVQSGRFLTHALATDPGDLAVKRGLAKALLETNQFALARVKAMEILDQEPTDGEALIMMANTSLDGPQVAELSSRLSAFNSEKSAPFHLVSAIIASRTGDLAGAKNALDLALAINPVSEQVHLALAAYHEAVKDPGAVLASLKKASELSPPRSLTRLRYAKALASSGKVDEAVAMVRELTQKHRYYLPAWTQLAEFTLQAKDPKAALELLNQVLTRDATNADARMLRASVLNADGKTGEAAKEMEELSGIYPGNLGVKMNLARSFLANNDSIRAAGTLEEVLILAPDYVEAKLLLAQTKISSGEAIAASDAMEKLLQKRPGQPQAEQLLAAAYQAQGRLDEAADVYRGQIARDDKQPGPHFMLGMILRQQGKGTGALASLQKAQSLAPKDQTVTFQLIELDIERKDFETAHRRAAEQETHHPGSWTVPFLQGKVFSAEGKWDEAEKSLLASLALQPDSLTIHNLLLDGYMKQGRIPEVISRLENYLEQKPKSIPQRMILALLYSQQGQTVKQVSAYERILVDDPNSITALNNLAYLNAGPLNNMAKAQELATRARTIKPDSAEIADTLGWILFQQKDYPQALSLIEEAATKLPANAEVQYHLGMARYMQGQKDTARTALEKAVAAKEPYAGIEQAKEYLGQLTGGGTAEKAATIESLTQRLKEAPGDVTARTRLAQLQEAAGQFPEAAASYQEALKGNAGLIDALLALSRLYAGPLANPAQATDFAKRARALDGRSPAAARALGEAVLHQGDFRYANTLLQEAALAGKPDPALKVKLARAAYGTGKTEQARSLMQEITAQPGEAPEKAVAQRFLALTSAPADAAAAAEALKENPDDLPALMAQAGLLLQEGKTSESLAALEQLLKKQPEFVPVWKEFAALLATQEGRIDEAQTLAEKARQALPGDPAVARTLGIIRSRKGSFEPAISLLRESDAKVPLDAEALFYLGTSQLAAGQKDNGVATLKRAVGMTGLPEALKQKAQESLDKIEAADKPAP
ncbi:MAG: tetratricopeptide repeat protein [Verrucomicrobiota bacterium]